MKKKIIHVEIDEGTLVGTDGINNGLGELCKLAESSIYLEKILNTAILSLYHSLPNGKENYGRNNQSKIGFVSVNRFNNPEVNLQIRYNPSHIYGEKFEYIQAVIGVINLKEKSVLLRYSKNSPDNVEYDESY